MYPKGIATAQCEENAVGLQGGRGALEGFEEAAHRIAPDGAVIAHDDEYLLPMRLATFNILHGRSSMTGWSISIGWLMLSALLDADIFALQEVDRDQPRSHLADLTAVAAEAMGAVTHRFAAALSGTPGAAWIAASENDLPGVASYGIALLSRYPALPGRFSGYRGSRPPSRCICATPRKMIIVKEEPRAAVIGRLRTPAGSVVVANTHLSYVPGWGRLQLRRIQRDLAPLQEPVILMGDLNMADNRRPQSPATDRWPGTSPSRSKTRSPARPHPDARPAGPRDRHERPCATAVRPPRAHRRAIHTRQGRRRQMINTDNYIRWERVDSVSQTATGILAELHRERLKIDVVRADVLRIKISRGGVFDESPTFAVCVDPLASAVDSRSKGPRRVRLITAAMHRPLWLDPFRIDVHRSDGSPVIETAQEPTGRYWAYATLNDSFTVRRRCRQEDAIFGLGEKSGGHNRKGRDFTMWNTDVLSPDETLEFTARQGRRRSARRSTQRRVRSRTTSPSRSSTTSPIPAGSMAASFVDNGYRGAYEFSSTEEYRIVFGGGQYTEYVFAGPDMPAILESYTWLTGRTAPPPIWSLGYHQCRWFDYTQDAVEAIAQRHRDNDIPCDAMWLDIEYMDGYRVFTWNTDRFPDPPGMLKRLAEQGLPGDHDHRSRREVRSWLLGLRSGRRARCVLPHRRRRPLHRPGVAGQHRLPRLRHRGGARPGGASSTRHTCSGLAGIWNDMNEPATGNIDARPMRFGRGEYSHERYHNQYALLMAMATTAGLLDAMPERRTFVLSRAGFAGIQRYAANWMGDNQSRWDHLWLSIAMGSGFGISGQAFVGADIGGFQGNSNAELFLRWMQYGTLTPFCRNHSEIGNVDQYAWAFGDVIQDHVRTAIKLRYRLLPYLYACFLTASETGEPVQRPMIFDYQYDATVRDIDDQYLLGTDLLVAPVVGPGITARQVYLPAGDWYDWHTGELVGGRRVPDQLPTPMDRIPVYRPRRRGDSDVAGGAGVDRRLPPRVVELHLFVPASDGVYHSMLQEDDGLTFAALKVLDIEPPSLSPGPAPS